MTDDEWLQVQAIRILNAEERGRELVEQGYYQISSAMSVGSDVCFAGNSVRMQHESPPRCSEGHDFQWFDAAKANVCTKCFGAGNRCPPGTPGGAASKP